MSISWIYSETGVKCPLLDSDIANKFFNVSTHLRLEDIFSLNVHVYVLYTYSTMQYHTESTYKH
jgi:hypothetical protein